jgi:hypothetical protein
MEERESRARFPPPATAGIGVPICAKGQDEPEGRAEEGDARCHRTATIAVGFRDAVVAGLAGSSKLCLLPNGLCGFKDVGPQNICSWATIATKESFAGRACGSR